MFTHVVSGMVRPSQSLEQRNASTLNNPLSSAPSADKSITFGSFACCIFFLTRSSLLSKFLFFLPLATVVAALTAHGRNYAIIPCAAELTSGFIGALSATTVNKKLKKKIKKISVNTKQI